MRNHFIPALGDRRRALLIGDGDGRFAAALLQSVPLIQAFSVDQSPAMLALQKERCAFAGQRFRTLAANALELPDALLHSAARGTDLVVTHFSLDCLTTEDVRMLAITLSRAGTSGMLWLVSDFGLPGRQPWRALAGGYVRLLYLAFRLLTGLRVRRLPQIAPALEDSGFLLVQRHSIWGGFLYTELWQQAPGLQTSADSRATSRTPAPSTSL